MVIMRPEKVGQKLAIKQKEPRAPVKNKAARGFYSCSNPKAATGFQNLCGPVAHSCNGRVSGGYLTAFFFRFRVNQGILTMIRKTSLRQSMNMNQNPSPEGEIVLLQPNTAVEGFPEIKRHSVRIVRRLI